MIAARRLALQLATFLFLAASASAQTPTPQCVDINTASLELLQEIIHIGPVRAEAIIAMRAQRPFESVAELVRISGIAAGRLEDIREQGLACVRSSGSG